MRTCLYCNKELILLPTTNPYEISSFHRKKFCNKGCRISFNNLKQKEKYITKEKEHYIKLKELNLSIRGHLPNVKTRRKSYTSDIILDDKDYELEIYTNKNHFEKKAQNWDKSRKHILVIAASDHSKSLFDEIYFFNNGRLIKEK